MKTLPPLAKDLHKDFDTNQIRKISRLHHHATYLSIFQQTVSGIHLANVRAELGALIWVLNYIDALEYAPIEETHTELQTYKIKLLQRDK